LKSRCDDARSALWSRAATPSNPNARSVRSNHCGWLPSERKFEHVSATAAVRKTTTILRSVAGVVAARASVSARTSVT